jgi:hypothetical protein
VLSFCSEVPAIPLALMLIPSTEASITILGINDVMDSNRSSTMDRLGPRVRASRCGIGARVAPRALRLAASSKPLMASMKRSGWRI